MDVRVLLSLALEPGLMDPYPLLFPLVSS
jgi:hypothetical protein